MIAHLKARFLANLLKSKRLLVKIPSTNFVFFKSSFLFNTAKVSASNRVFHLLLYSVCLFDANISLGLLLSWLFFACFN